MAKYIVAETVTLLHYIEAESEMDALLEVQKRGVGEFDEVDGSQESKFSVRIDND